MTQATVSEKPFHNSNLFTDYYLKNNITELEEWEETEEAEVVFQELKDLYEKEGELARGQKEDALLDKWIDPVLEILGYGETPEPTLPDGGGYIDRLLYESDDVRRKAELQAADGDASEIYGHGCGLLEAKQWDTDFTKRFSEDRQYRDASHQVKFYLEHTPETIQWGVLTDGKKWRLYGTKDYETETYYQIDLPELLESGDVEDFKYFYLFFRPEAFREVAGTTFLDTVWNESESAAQELGEDLQDNVFTALRVLGKGFVETNDLDIDPDDEEKRDELKEQSLVLLYRLMFVLYAESRHLIDPDDPDAQREYTENFSLDQKRSEIRQAIDEEGETFTSEYSEYSTSIWQRLQDLFRLIDEGKEDLDIPAYNGGLFDTEEHEFLTENAVADEYLAEVIYRISTTETDDGEFVLADYSDLDTRHLGSIYEGLLEHEFRIAPEQYAAVSEDGGQVWKPATEVSVADAVETVSEGSLYVVNDEGERKATGSYYTPDYVVTYIVEETVDPLIDDIKADLEATDLEPGTMEYVTEFWKQVKDLKVLDPAMGSGHFLTKATGYIAEQVMNEVRELETATVFNEKQIRREVSKECIYGVDLNGMAVELAKLSMWLETLATDQPLAFLDHHLKTGNSLVGSDISEILSTSDDDGPSGQTTLSDWMEQTRREALEHVMELMQDLLAIENESLDDIKAMERTYEEIRDDPLFTHLLEMASVHTASQFGLDVPDDADEQMARALRDESWDDVAETDWFRSAQAMAATEEFFHWELEFPEVFFSEDGEIAGDAGFDAVVGNPPYMGTTHISSNLQEYYSTTYSSATGKWDIYCLFTEKGISIVRGKLGFIQPTMFMRRDYGKGLRKYLVDSSTAIEEIIDLSEISVFKGATNYVGVFVIEAECPNDEFTVYPIKELPLGENLQSSDDYTLKNSELSAESWPVIPPTVRKLVKNTPNSFVSLGEVTDVMSEGIKTGYNNAFVVKKSKAEENDLEGDILKPFLKGKDVKRYSQPKTNLLCIYPYKSGEKLSEGELSRNFPNVYEYLRNFKESLSDRPSVGENKRDWYELEREREPVIYESPKLLTPDISSQNNFTIDASDDQYFNTKVKSIKLKPDSSIEYKQLLGFLNSSVVEYIYRGISPPKRGGYRAYKPSVLSKLKIPTDGAGEIAKYADKILSQKAVLENLNLSLRDYLGNYSEGQTLPEIGFSQPPKNSADSILHETTETREKLQIERAEVERESSTTVTIHLTARYKPEDEDDHDLDQYGYTETDFLPALRITDLTETEADLIEAFVPVAVDEAGGFAGFRDNATKTNSLIDRLEKLTLPKVDDVENGLESYIETKERADELEQKIEKTDDLIDQIVYELYGLTDEEIEIVENAVGE